MAMTNNQIIFFESMELMEQGIIKGCGQFAEVTNEAGEVERVELPEDIHTFATWKKYGRQVRKGEKARASFKIWKQGKRKAKEPDEEKETFMFMKLAYFFTIDQTDPIEA